MKPWQFFHAFVFSTVLSTGCNSQDPESAGNKLDAGSEPSVHDVGLRPEQLTGTYLFGISTILARSAPIVFMVELAGEAQDDRLDVRLRFRPISKLDRVTPVGEWSEWTNGEVDADGHWNSHPLHVIIPADANAIIATDTEAEIVLQGDLLALRSDDDPAAELDFLCGDVTGEIIDPVPLDDLSGSTFAGTRIADLDDPASYPEITINCDHGLPRPLSQ